ncbi:unnamed protein product [Linum trigynum]|uniref:Uncharacterized protein n=1 Tax=Linum trigynum TaxID=586398 RepID=A0AAV2E065_9ROSI
MLVSPSSDVRIRFRRRGDDPGIVLFAMITTTQRKLEVAYAGIVVGTACLLLLTSRPQLRVKLVQAIRDEALVVVEEAPVEPIVFQNPTLSSTLPPCI